MEHGPLKLTLNVLPRLTSLVVLVTTHDRLPQSRPSRRGALCRKDWLSRLNPWSSTRSSPNSSTARLPAAHLVAPPATNFYQRSVAGKQRAVAITSNAANRQSLVESRGTPLRSDLPQSSGPTRATGTDSHRRTGQCPRRPRPNAMANATYAGSARTISDGANGMHSMASADPRRRRRLVVSGKPRPTKPRCIPRRISMQPRVYDAQLH